MKPFSSAKNRTILIVEDSQEDQILFHSAFQEAGVPNPLVFVNSGNDALEYLQSTAGSIQGVSLIILDILLKDMSGFEVLKEIKNDTQIMFIPVIMITASLDPQFVQTTYELGGTSFIRKPAKTEDFKSVIFHLANYWLKVCELPV